MIFETHAHYDDEAFDGDREQLLCSLPEKGIARVVNVGASIETTKSTLALAEKYDFVYAAVGVHPSDIAGLNEKTYAWLKEQTMHPKAVAVGEIGLDYYWDKEPEVQMAQQEWFRRQLALAKECSLPVIIHSRDAAEDTMRIIKEAGSWKTRSFQISGEERSASHTREKATENVCGAIHCYSHTREEATENACGVIHCYSYSPEQAKEYVKLGYYIGVGGVVTFKNARKLKETVQQIPLERILLETDCPYMAPEPHRGTRNDSSYLSYVAAKIAELKEVTVEEVERVTWENACRLFGMK